MGGAEGPVDTVYLGVFRRSAVEAVGGFDERLTRNQDYELNIRLREAGGTVWFDPELWVSYRPRGTVRKLASQYFQYGQWKRAVLRLHPDSLKVRQAAPVIVTLAVVGGCVGALWSPWLLAVPAGYLERGRGGRARRGTAAGTAGRRGAGDHASVMGRGLPPRPARSNARGHAGSRLSAGRIVVHRD